MEKTLIFLSVFILALQDSTNLVGSNTKVGTSATSLKKFATKVCGVQKGVLKTQQAPQSSQEQKSFDLYTVIIYDMPSIIGLNFTFSTAMGQQMHTFSYGRQGVRTIYREGKIKKIILWVGNDVINGMEISARGNQHKTGGTLSGSSCQLTFSDNQRIVGVQIAYDDYKFYQLGFIVVEQQATTANDSPENNPPENSQQSSRKSLSSGDITSIAIAGAAFVGLLVFCIVKLTRNPNPLVQTQPSPSVNPKVPAATTMGTQQSLDRVRQTDDRAIQNP